MTALTLGLLLLVSSATAAPYRSSIILPLSISRGYITERVSNPSSAKVTNGQAFITGAGNNDNSNLNDGVGAGSDSYQCYYGSWESYPSIDKWVSFDAMFTANKKAMTTGCGDIGQRPEDTEAQIQGIYNGIQQVAQASLVDHRFILATIMQESIGCVHVPTSNNGDSNPGLMQSEWGASFVGNNASASAQQASITQMIVDGTQGTTRGDGLVQGINRYGNVYEAARWYNSGQVDSEDLNNADGATESYVTDIANRLTGWVNAKQGSC